MSEAYDGARTAIKELVAQGIFNPDDAVRFAIRDLVACGSFQPDEAVKAAVKELDQEKPDLRSQLAAKTAECERLREALVASPCHCADAANEQGMATECYRCAALAPRDEKPAGEGADMGNHVNCESCGGACGSL